jgi:hypothetical protein
VSTEISTRSRASERDDWDVHSACGQSYPRLTVMLEDMQGGGEQFTIEVPNLDAGFRSRSGWSAAKEARATLRHVFIQRVRAFDERNFR